jgi:hypothetical protein
MHVNQTMHSLGLFLDHQQTPIEESEVVIAVDLIWLRWNHDPDHAEENRYDYKISTEHGVLRLLEDIDTVGRDFIASISSPNSMAELLVNLREYPCRIKWGGRPGSVYPYVYAALLYMQMGDKERAKAALDKGWREYDTPTPRPHWQNVRLQGFQTRRMLLMRYMGFAG